MKYAAYTEDDIWAVADTAELAKSAGETAMRDLEATDDEVAELETAPIADDLIAALAIADEDGSEVMFDLIDGRLILADGDEGEDEIEA